MPQLPFLCGLAVLVLDQLTKHWAVSNPEGWWVVQDWFHTQLHWNTGISFSLFANTPLANEMLWGISAQQWALALLAVVVSIFLMGWANNSTRTPQQLALLAIAAGALGNATDRIRFGAVVDFLSVKLPVMNIWWPSFNLADAAICCGVIFLLVESVVWKRA